MKKVYLCEVGVLLENNDSDYVSYCSVYDKKHGFFDENQYYSTNLKEAKKELTHYVKNGVDGTYGVISLTDVPKEETDVRELPVEGETYLANDVLFSVVKINSKLKYDFIEK